MATNPFHRWLIRQRRWCEKCTSLTAATHVENYNGRDTVLCHEHASRLANVRKSEKAFELQENKTETKRPRIEMKPKGTTCQEQTQTK